MAESTTKKNSAPDSSREESYRMAKLLRAGNRELARQLAQIKLGGQMTE